LYFRNLIAWSLSFSSFFLCASDLGFGFNTGLSSSAGNIHSGCGLSGAFFFFFLCGGTWAFPWPRMNSGLISTGAFFTLPFFAIFAISRSGLGLTLRVYRKVTHKLIWCAGRAVDYSSAAAGALSCLHAWLRHPSPEPRASPRPGSSPSALLLSWQYSIYEMCESLTSFCEPDVENHYQP